MALGKGVPTIRSVIVLTETGLGAEPYIALSSALTVGRISKLRMSISFSVGDVENIKDGSVKKTVCSIW